MDRPQYLIGLFITHAADRRLLAAYLSDSGYTAAIIDLAAVDPEEWLKFDLVLADEHAGQRYYQQLMALKMRQGTFFLPILILLANTTNSTPWLTAGFDDILRIPLTKAELGARVAVFLRVRAQSQAAFTLTEDRFRALVEYSSDGITLLDAHGRGLYRSPASERLSGYRTEERHGREVFDLFHPDDLPMARAYFATLLKTPGSVQTIQYRSQHKDGSWHWIEAVVTNLLHEPSVQAIIANFRDITERKQAEARLRQSEERFRLLVEGVMDYAIIMLDPTGHVMSWNLGAERIKGYQAHEIIGQHISRFYPEADVQCGKPAQELVIAVREKAFHEQGMRVRKDGSQFIADVTITTLLDEDGTLRGFAEVTRDSTERNRAEQALVQSEARFSTMFRSSPAAISLTRLHDGHFLDMNEAYHHLLGYHRDEVIGQSSITLNVYADPNDRAKLVQLLHEQGSIRDYELKLCTKSGEVREVVCAIEAIKLANEDYLLTSLYDITERKQIELALLEERTLLAQRVDERTADLSAANAELARAVRLKDEFLAGMSHELRTPLNAILGLSEALQEQIYGPLNEVQLQRLRSIEESGRHLLALINDILDLAKIGAGMLELTIEPVIVESICYASMQMIKQVAYQKNLAVTTRIDPAVVRIQGDIRRIKQMLINLLANAVKFTPAGGAIGLEVVGDPTQQTIRFTVWDTGIGIADEHMRNLFQPFVQIDSQLARQYEGTGLGLALVARMAELHGGSVTVTSTVGVGSRFTVTLPWSTTTLVETLHGSTPQGRGQHLASRPPRIVTGTLPVLLLADDNETTRMLLADYLTLQGYRVVIARNGHEAIARVDDTHPAMVLMDIQMPSMDGLVAIQHIRANANQPVLPIIALTALAMPGDRERCLAAGATEYLTKPVSLRGLADLIETHLQHQGNA